MYKLRELEKQDLGLINKWRNDEDLISFLGAPFRYINLEVEEEWYTNYLKNRSSCLRCSIVKKDNKDIILGLVSLTDINYLNQSATLHLMIGDPKQRGKGIGTFAINEILEHARKNLNLRRIELSVLASNERALKLYEKMGFEKEGLKKEAVLKDGKFEDMVIMANFCKER